MTQKQLNKLDEWIARNVFNYEVVVDDAQLSASDGVTYYERNGGRIAYWHDDVGPIHSAWSPTREADVALAVLDKILQRCDIAIRYDKPGQFGAGKPGRYVAGMTCHSGVDWEAADTGSLSLSITICLMAKSIFTRK